MEWKIKWFSVYGIKLKYRKKVGCVFIGFRSGFYGYRVGYLSFVKWFFRGLAGSVRDVYDIVGR